ncbi:G-type lectin S-receptor-like serine/threonine-protein kinase [Panicum miliaceum]|uniref:G-type lectin S-receptor-like serine/threonine-protein kinase n=1 Tax=Panicum miliaceum TaxID=4540 RepID=A0A3L6RCL0_PANMI|nr:G-type lectin S-receptor-like serine/threonine-protein kinase [Panicum miliaceum]
MGRPGYSFRFVDNDRESYFTYNFADNSTVYRFVTDVSGQVKGWFWVEAWKRWNLVYAEPKARDAAATACGCARGFAPRDAASWSLGDHTGGCVRNAELRCGENGSTAAGSETKADRFFRMDDMRLPDGGRVAGVASSGECESACLGECTCFAYAYNGSCVLWDSELQNLADGYGSQPGAGSLYLRLAASEFPRAKSHRRRTVQIAVGALAIVCFVLVASILIVRATMARRTKKVQGLTSAEGSVTSFKVPNWELTLQEAPNED